MEGNAAYKARKFEEAIVLYNQAIELNPDELTFYTNLGAVYFEMKNFDACIAECDKAIAKAKEGPYDFVKLGKALARKANALCGKGDMEASIATYKAALLENNDVHIRDALKRVEKTKKEAEIKAYINPELGEKHKDAGNALFKEGDFPGAVKEFTEGLRRDPNSKAIYSNRSAAYIKLMEPVAGLKDADKCLELDPNFVKAWARKGTCHHLMKEYHKAMNAFEQGLKLDADNKECKEGHQKTLMTINSTAHASSGNDEERMRHAMADPEIQMIMRDPRIQQVLKDMQENPVAG